LWKIIQHVSVKGIFLIRLVILARLLSPQDFGLWAIALVVIDVLMGVTDFGMIPALVQRSDANDKHFNAAWTIDMLRALIITTLVIFVAPFVAQFFAAPQATEIIRVVAIRPTILAAASIKMAELARKFSFRPLAFIKLTEAVANTVVAVALAPSLGIWALVAGALAGPTAYLATSYILAQHRPRLCFDYTTVRPLINYGRWVFLTGMIAVVGSLMLRAVISRQLGAVELGLYFLAAKLAFLPAEIASEMVGAVSFPLYARLQSDVSKAVLAFQSILIGLSALLFPICAIMIAIAPSLVQDVLGPRWEGTVPIIRVLALVNIIGLFGETVVPILKGIGQPYKITMIEVLQTSLLILLIWSLIDRLGIVGAALAWLPAVTVSQIISANFLQQILPRPFAKLGTPMLVIIAASGVGAAVALGVVNMVSGLTGFVMANLFAAGITAVLLWASDRWLALGLSAGLSRAFPQIVKVQ
jgi:O-antigen/teichoic acid export membrane protein